jgi:Flp pilus assembly protein TadD
MHRRGARAFDDALLVFVLALVLRAVHLAFVSRSPYWGVPLGDARSYLAWASTLAAGDWIGSETFYQAPLYPYVLGVVLGLGGTTTTLLAVQAIVGSLACAVLAIAGRQWFDRTAGLGAGVLFAAYGPAIFFDGIVQKSTLDALLVALLLLALARTSAPRSFAGGVALGLLALTRENALGLAPVLVAWVARVGTAGARWGRSLAFAAGVLVALAPVALRNVYVGGELHPTTAQLGPNFWIGNHAGASGFYEPLRYARGDARVEREDATLLAERAVGHPLTPGQVSDYWRDRAVADIVADPVAWLRLLARKGVLTWNATEWNDTEDPYTYASFSPVLRVTLHALGFGVLTALAGAGLVLLGRRVRSVWLLPAWLVTYTLLAMLFFVFARYRYPLVPVLALLGGFGIAEVLRVDPRRRRPALATFAALVVLCHLPLGDRSAMAGTTWTNLGIELAARGDTGGARDAYERALTANPASIRASTNLAAIELADGHPEAALERLESLAARAPHSSVVWDSHGRALAALGRDRDALTSFTRATQADPADANAWIDLGLTEHRLGNDRAAEQAFRHALEASPEDPRALVDLGVVLAERGDLAAAEALFERAARAGAGRDAEENLARVRNSMAEAP